MIRSKKNSRSSVSDGATVFTLLLSLAATAIIFQSVTCHGQEPLPEISGVCAPNVDNRRAFLDHGGDRGIWFQRDVATCMLTRLQALPLYTERISLMEDRLRIGDERTSLLREAVSLADQEADRAVVALESAVRGRRAAEEALTVWHRSRGLWVSVGVLVAGMIVAITAYALHATRSES